MGVSDIGLAPRHILDMSGIHQKDREVSFQQVRHRMPIDASRNLANYGGHYLKKVAQKSD